VTMGKRYEELGHTADIRFRIYGADERELFSNAAFALFDKMVDLSAVRASEAIEVEVSGADAEETLVNFLSEILYRFDAEKFIARVRDKGIVARRRQVGMQGRAV